MEENIQAWKLFASVFCTQVRVGGMGSVVGIDLSLLPWLCKVYNIPEEDHAILLDKLVLLGKIMTKHCNEGDESDGKV